MKIIWSQFEVAVEEDDQPHSKSIFNASIKDLFPLFWQLEARKSRIVEW